MQDAQNGFVRLLRNFQTLIGRLPFDERLVQESERDIGENVQCENVNVEAVRISRVHELKDVL